MRSRVLMAIRTTREGTTVVIHTREIVPVKDDLAASAARADLAESSREHGGRDTEHRGGED